MPRLSILDLEQRINVEAEAKKYKDIYAKFQSAIDKEFFLLPFVGTSQNVDMYFIERDIFFNLGTGEGATSYILYLISFYETCISYLQIHYGGLLYRMECNINLDRIADHNILLLNILNYQIIYEEEYNQHGFKTPLIVKRDTDVDSVLPLVNSDIRIDLLIY